MKRPIPQGFRDFREVRDELGQEQMWADLEAGKLVAVRWGHEGDLQEFFPQYWRSGQADYTIRNGVEFSRHGGPRSPLLVKRPEAVTAPHSRKTKGGRPASYDWDAFHRELIRIANAPDGLPETQADLERVMQEWCARQWGVEPGESTIREKVSLVYRDIREAGN